MTARAITVGIPCAPPRLVGRVLAEVVRDNDRDASRFVDMNADTFRMALAPGEQSFVAVLSDREGRVVDVWEYPRTIGAARITHGRASARKTTTKTTRSTNGRTT